MSHRRSLARAGQSCDDAGMRLRRDESLLLVIDLQARLAPAIEAVDRVLERARFLIQAARRLKVPILATEQYPKGLGPTVPAIAELLEPGEILEKIHFGCVDEPACAGRIAEAGRRQVVVIGTEAHVCVLQSAAALKEKGLAPYVVADAVGSRRAADKESALARLAQAGVPVVTSEMVAFEWLERAGTPEFKDLQALIR